MNTDPPPQSTPGASRLLWVLALASFTSMASMRACDSLLPQLAHEFATSTGAAAQTIAAFALAYGVLQVVYGPMGDRIGKTRVITAAALCCSVANLAIALAPSLQSAVVWRALAGGAAGGIVPLSIATIGDTVVYGRRQETLARLSLATIGGMIAGQWLGGMAAEIWNWRVVFFALAACFALTAVPLMVTARRTPRPAAAAAGSLGYIAQVGLLWRQRWSRTVLATTAVEGMFAIAPFSFVPSHLHASFGLSLGRAGAVMALYGVGGICFALLARPVIRRLGERGLVAAGGTALALAMTALAWSPHWGLMAVACFVGGLGMSMLHSTLQTHATQMLPQVRGTAVSMFVVCLFGGQSMGVVLAAAVVDHSSPRGVFAASAVVLPLLAFLFRRALLRHQREGAVQG